MTTMLLQEPVYKEHEVLYGLKQYDQNATIQVNQILYYPYYFLEYELSAKSLLKLDGKMACTIDAISGKGAIIDVQPDLTSRPLVDETCLPAEVTEERAKELAEKFVFETISQKTKFVTIPSLTLLHCSLFLRPFWLAAYGVNEWQSKQVIVDAISGSYHPL